MNCPSCGTPVPVGNPFCGNCGSPMPLPAGAFGGGFAAAAAPVVVIRRRFYRRRGFWWIICAIVAIALLAVATYLLLTRETPIVTAPVTTPGAGLPAPVQTIVAGATATAVAQSGGTLPGPVQTLVAQATQAASQPAMPPAVQTLVAQATANAAAPIATPTLQPAIPPTAVPAAPPAANPGAAPAAPNPPSGGAGLTDFQPVEAYCTLNGQRRDLAYDPGQKRVYMNPWMDEARKVNDTQPVPCKIRTSVPGSLEALGRKTKMSPGEWTYTFPVKDGSLGFAWQAD